MESQIKLNPLPEPPVVTLPAVIATDELVGRVYDGSRVERREAELLLLDGRPERTDALIAVVQRENKKKTRRFAYIAGGVVIAFIVVIGGIGALLSGKGANVGSFGYPLWMAAALIPSTARRGNSLPASDNVSTAQV